ncbi:MAG: CCA tRNA nucleotidyltransferase [Dehalococcoidia bacterium]|nr:CCA tRNA nucleotidyltransferase [Dehalococcoidia bacterium]
MKFGNFSIARQMESRIETDTLRAVGRAAKEIGVKPYLVGGSVRDLIVGAPTSPDLDITLVGTTSETFDDIARRVSGEITKRSQFGTVAMKVGGYGFDLIIARAESYPMPGSLPVVRPGTLAEDLARRDFSVNAMAVSLAESDWGDLFDPQGGLNDLRARMLRILYPDSFRDDATRILRAARYASRLSLALSPDTEDHLLDSVGFISKISPARMRDELERVFLESQAAAALGLLEEWGALSAISPALEYEADAWSLYSERTDGLSKPGRIAVGYAILGATMSVPESTGVAARLKLGARARRALRDAAELADRIDGGEFEGAANSAVAEALDALSKLGVMGCAIVRAGSPIGGRMEEYLRVHRPLRTMLTGDDIIALGVPQGPEVGRIQRWLRAARQDGLIESRVEEEAFVLDRLKASQ